MTPIDERKESNITSADFGKKVTRADDIKNFLVHGKFKNTRDVEVKRNQMKHLTPKKKKRKK